MHMSGENELLFEPPCITFCKTPSFSHVSSVLQSTPSIKRESVRKVTNPGLPDFCETIGQSEWCSPPITQTEFSRLSIC